MMRKVLGWLAVAVIVLFILNNPTGAADMVSGTVSALTTFVDRMAG